MMEAMTEPHWDWRPGENRELDGQDLVGIMADNDAALALMADDGFWLAGEENSEENAVEDHVPQGFSDAESEEN